MRGGAGRTRTNHQTIKGGAMSDQLTLSNTSTRAPRALQVAALPQKLRLCAMRGKISEQRRQRLVLALLRRQVGKHITTAGPCRSVSRICVVALSETGKPGTPMFDATVMPTVPFSLLRAKSISTPPYLMLPPRSMMTSRSASAIGNKLSNRTPMSTTVSECSLGQLKNARRIATASSSPTSADAVAASVNRGLYGQNLRSASLIVILEWEHGAGAKIQS